MRFNDDDYVREQYRTTENLETRASVWRASVPGRSPQDVVFTTLSEIRPRRVLEVGAGKGELAMRIADSIKCEVVALDSSSTMVAASRSLGVVSTLGDVRTLPFADGSFDAVVAAWMLYHVSELDKALAELARVLRPNGRLVAVTNGQAHLEELWRAAGAEHDEPSFSVENGAEYLGAAFASVERHDVATHALFADRSVARAYLASVGRLDLADQLAHADWPLRARGATAVFVADRPQRRSRTECAQRSSTPA